jgi:diguanylate cyclase (GGDEF)-like protein/PAS domain S-box-containing protein
LRKAGYEVNSLCVQNAEDMQAALQQQTWDLIICDQQMHNFNVIAAMRVLKLSARNIPFIIVSGAISEDIGVDMMIAGAQDFVLKSNMNRLVPAVRRELADAAARYAGYLSARSLRETEGRYRTIIEATSDAVTRFDRHARHQYGNPAALGAAGLSLMDYIGTSHRKLGYPDHLCRMLEEKLNTVFATGKAETLELNSNPNNNGAIIEMRLFPEFGTDGKVISVVGIGRDITQKKRSEALIWRQANFDALTGLANRQMFHHSLDECIKQAKRTHQPFALLFIDLDKFKEINDILGHAAGDQLLIEIAQRMSRCLREVDLLARLGGDEFGALIADIADAPDAQTGPAAAPMSIERVTDSILSSVAAPFYFEEERIFISTSIGISYCPTDADNARDLLKFADQALFEAKHAGRGCWRQFSRELDVKAEAKMRLTNELHDAITEHQFRIYYQPIIDLRTGIINKAEALIRWQHPTHGLICPVNFISAAESCGLIVEMGNWVFKESTLQQQRWRKQFNPAFQISVNLSPAQFRHVGALSKTWLAHLQTMPSDNCVAVEITESLLLDASTDVLDTLLALRNTGIKIVIDDFGTGYSSLQYLKKFGVDYLKIDQSFVFDLETNAIDRALCESIIDIAHKLGIKAIAEGVEMAGQRTVLADAGCDYAQGYLFSKPLSAKALEGLLWPHH